MKTKDMTVFPSVSSVQAIPLWVWRAGLCLTLLAFVFLMPEAWANKIFEMPGGSLDLPGVGKDAKWYTKIIYGIILVVVLLFLSMFIIGLANAIRGLFAAMNDMRTNNEEKQGGVLTQVGMIILCVLMSFLLMWLGWEYGIKPLTSIADS